VWWQALEILLVTQAERESAGGSCISPDDVQLFAKRCNDVSVLTRKQAMSSLSSLTISDPTNRGLRVRSDGSKPCSGPALKLPHACASRRRRGCGRCCRWCRTPSRASSTAWGSSSRRWSSTVSSTGISTGRAPASPPAALPAMVVIMMRPRRKVGRRSGIGLRYRA
jgi:hypothetical protein